MAEFRLKKQHKNPEGGLSQKGRDAYNRATGSNLQAPVSRKQAIKSKAKAARRKSFYKRMLGMRKELTSKKTAKDPNSRINKALRRWDC
jgi:hypothetical protein